MVTVECREDDSPLLSFTILPELANSLLAFPPIPIISRVQSIRRVFGSTFQLPPEPNPSWHLYGSHHLPGQYHLSP